MHKMFDILQVRRNVKYRDEEVHVILISQSVEFHSSLIEMKLNNAGLKTSEGSKNVKLLLNRRNYLRDLLGALLISVE